MGALLWAWLRVGGSPRFSLNLQSAKSNLPSVRSQYDGQIEPLTLPQVEATAPLSLSAEERYEVIVFTSRELGRRRLYAYWPGASLFAPLTGGDWDDVDPAFSPDGEGLAIASDRGGQWDLYVLEAGQSAARQLTATQGFERHPTWSPDGGWLAFEADYGGNLDIWMLPVDSPGEPIQLTTDPGEDFSPAWHPDGGSIVFVSNRDGQKDLYVADLDAEGGGITNLTHTTDGDEDDPRFSPDGRQISYTLLSRDGVAQILRSDWPFGSSPLHTVGQGGGPVWSPDGNSIAARLQGREAGYLLTFPLHGSGAPRLLDFPPGRYESLAWAETKWLVPTDGARGTMEALRAEPAFSGSPSSAAELGTVSELSMVEAPNPYLLTGVNQAFDALRTRTAELAGWDFLGNLENAFVGLDEPLPPGAPYEDWLRTGRAFSFHLGALKAEWVEISREDYAGQTYWRVFARVRPQDGTRGEPLRRFVWDFDARYTGDPLAYDQGGALKSWAPSGYYLDFTALAADYGFERLPALPNWRTYYHGSRFNQFVFREGLSWEEAMLEIYPAAAIATPTPFRTPTATATLTLVPTWTPIPTITPWVWPTSTATPEPVPVVTGEAP